MQRGILVSFGMRDAFDNGGKYLFHAHTRLARRTDYLFTFATQQFHNLIFHLFGIGACHITFIDNRDNFEIVLNRHIQVGNSLCLYTLRRIDNQQRTLASGNRTGHLIREVHVSRSVNQVKDILLTLIGIFHLDSMALDRDSPFFLQVHIIKHLSRSHLNSLGIFQQAVGQSRFTVVNMSNNTKIAYILHSEFLLFYLFGVQIYVNGGIKKNALITF